MKLYGAPFPPLMTAVPVPLQLVAHVALVVFAVRVIDGGCVILIVNVLIHVGVALACNVYWPAHCPVITEELEMTLAVGGASHVNVIGGGGPAAVTDTAPVQLALQTTLVIVGLIVIEVGCVMRNVCCFWQFRLSVIKTV